MARRGLDHAAVVAAARAIADADGLDAVSLARVAEALGVRPPSLYNHVDSREALVNAVGTAALAELTEAMRDATVGVAGDDAVHALATAVRAYALAGPGAYAAAQRAVPLDPARASAGASAVDVFLAIIRGYGLEGEDAIHAVRAVRSAVHGFVTLELGGGFGLDVDVTISFDRMIELLVAGLRAAGPDRPAVAASGAERGGPG